MTGVVWTALAAFMMDLAKQCCSAMWATGEQVANDPRGFELCFQVVGKGAGRLIVFDWRNQAGGDGITPGCSYGLHMSVLVGRMPRTSYCRSQI